MQTTPESSHSKTSANDECLDERITDSASTEQVQNVTSYVLRSELTPEPSITSERASIEGLVDKSPLYYIAEQVVAAVSLLLLFPFLLTVAIVVKCQQGASVFYSQIRVGKNGREFRIYKFRTMKEDAESDGPFICTSYEDPRITALGSIMRKAKIDELPQLFNIARGDMSFVGPRPERPHFHREFSKFEGWEKRVFVRPGLTGLAQASRYIAHDPERKLVADTIYIKNRTLLIDFAIICYTLLPFLRPKKLLEVPMA
ncbi:UNVERIFIED_CONTAM: hypothetical protein GTU68_067104 [Idotea baltica]|nr:hypothetical protein [Idotea baltica]